MLNGRKVASLRMHIPYHAKGLGQVPTVIDSGVDAKWRKDLVILKVDNGYLCNAKGDNGQQVYFFIEGTNCIGATLYDETR